MRTKRTSKRLGFASTGRRRTVTGVAPTTSAATAIRTTVLAGASASGRRREFTGTHGGDGGGTEQQ